jgi:hypothetical protein
MLMSTGAGVRTAGHLRLHRIPLPLQVLRIPEDRALPVPAVHDRPHGHRLPNPHGHDGTLRRGLPSSEGALPLHLRQGTNGPLRHRPLLRALQLPQVRQFPIRSAGRREATLDLCNWRILIRPAHLSE